ncbi:MAG: STAS-like domain-containing protein [Patescibacteria group bacterium]|nr:STAS-like domain-containing protein [Patescibacteria group bacterium]
MMLVKLVDGIGSFAENKEKAKDIRLNKLIPTLEKGEDIILDFKNIDDATQSFIHALISDLFRKYGDEVLNRISFKNCNETVSKVITIVADYMQETD